MKKTESPEFWKKLILLGQKQGAIRLTDLASEIGLEADETLSFLRQVFPVGVGIEMYHKEHEQWIDFKGDSINYMLPLTPSEWMSLHQILRTQKVRSPDISSLKKKVLENGPIKVVMELLNQLELWDQELGELQQATVQQLDQAIAQKNLLTLQTVEGKFWTVYACKILHIEGKISLIAEDNQDHCLMIMPISNLKGFEIIPSSSQPKVSAFEIEEFITAIRMMNEKETRLVLKINDPESANLFPDYHFLGKPCMITNPAGDLIWAAYVEPCDALYEWLLTLGKNVEILDPVKFKEQYFMYCEEKLRKIA